MHDKAAAICVGALGEGAFGAIEADGRSLPLDDAVAYALAGLPAAC